MDQYILAQDIYQAIQSSITDYEESIEWMCSNQQLQYAITKQ